MLCQGSLKSPVLSFHNTEGYQERTEKYVIQFIL